MNTHAWPGLFIAFEGLDGSGSSTQAAKLAQYLINLGYKTLLTKEPTNNLIGGLIRGQLTHEWASNMETLQLLFTADRAHHLEKTVIPALKKGLIVISDRYFFSSVAYGSLSLDTGWLLTLNDKFIFPDITYFLKVPAKEVVRRMKETREKLELFEKENKLKKVLASYKLLTEKYDNIEVIDGTQRVLQISGQIEMITKLKLSKKKLVRSGGLI